jgi:hypothetical protein
MVNVGLLSHDIKNNANVALDTTTLTDLANKAFNKWILLKVD